MKKLIIFFIAIFLLVPFVVQARIDCDSAGLPGDRTIAICNLLNSIETILWVFGIGLAVAVIIIAGIMYLVSGGDPGKTDKAKKTLTYGLIGAAIILLAVFIVRLLDEVIISKLGGSTAPLM